ncbi:MAG TPA: hypothetical protein VHA37_08575 [Candidatus Saccharimonadales bacterium]|nr:hypothetical protein [Candidatus Saccharimonadales bacterium]
MSLKQAGLTEPVERGIAEPQSWPDESGHSLLVSSLVTDIELRVPDRRKPLTDLLLIAAECETQLKKKSRFLGKQIASADNARCSGVIGAFTARARGGDEQDAFLWPRRAP